MLSTTRPTAVAGRFYPSDPGELAAQLEGYLGVVAPSASPRAPKVLVVPHAGYVYSGPVAAHAYAMLSHWRARIKRVVLLGPSHRVAVRGLAVPEVSAFETPLGHVPIDHAALALISDLPQMVTSDLAHAQEHSIEVQLPFLQTMLEDFTLVPLAVGETSAEDVAQVLDCLWGGEETLIVISTDLSHYMPYQQARAVDRDTVDRILALDPCLDHNQACGATPLGGALLAVQAHRLSARLLDLRNSGDTAGDRSRVVGYCAMAFEPQAPEANAQCAQSDEQDTALGTALLARARNAIAEAFTLSTSREPDHAALSTPGAVFVTLRRRGVLRGCIGTLRAERPLADEVRIQALHAAFRDQRFEPLQVEEFGEIDIEVSLLEPARPLPVHSELEAHQALLPGTDGIILEWRGQSATFLPQVWEQLPGPREFLAALKHKAGLPDDFWAPDLRLSRYRVRKFAETVTTA